MPVALICPSCNEAVEFDTAAAELCPHCGNPLPEPLRQASERQLARDELPRPFFLTLMGWFSGFFAAMSILVFALAPFDVGTYSIGDKSVSGPQFLQSVGVLFAASALAAAITSYAVFRRTVWAREVIMGLILVTALGSIVFIPDQTRDDRFAEVIGYSIFTALCAWYLYGKRIVRSYFRALKTRRSLGERAGS